MGRHSAPRKHAAPQKHAAQQRRLAGAAAPSPALPVLAVAITGVATFTAAALGTTQAAAGPAESTAAAPAQVLTAPTGASEVEARGEYGPSNRDLARRALQEHREEQRKKDGDKPRIASLPPSSDDEHGDREVLSTGECEASYYDTGSVTANGEPFDPSKLTAAHKTLPFDTMVRVVNKASNESVVVRINDRGPYIGGRCLDLTPPGMEKIAGSGVGTAQVRYEVLGKK